MDNLDGQSRNFEKGQKVWSFHFNSDKQHIICHEYIYVGRYGNLLVLSDGTGIPYERFEKYVFSSKEECIGHITQNIECIPVF